MDLKMFEFEGGVKIWICAEEEEQAIEMFKNWHGEDAWQECVECYEDSAIREMEPKEVFTYYHDGINAEKDTIENLIKKYCSKPDMFASSEI